MIRNPPTSNMIWPPGLPCFLSVILQLRFVVEKSCQVQLDTLVTSSTDSPFLKNVLLVANVQKTTPFLIRSIVVSQAVLPFVRVMKTSCTFVTNPARVPRFIPQQARISFTLFKLSKAQFPSGWAGV